MADLGKCLLFYLKYPTEMERLYETEEPSMDEIPNPEETQKKITLVGDAAGREAGDVLRACASIIEKHFDAIGQIERTKVNPDKSWQISFRVRPKGSPGNIQVGSPGNFQVGIDLSASNPPALQPWIWCRGGRAAESKMREALNASARSPEIRLGADLGWSSGNIALGQVEIDVPSDLNVPVPCEPLVEQVRNTFELLTEEHVRKLSAISGTN